MPYPFPPEATSLCVDIEPDRPGDEAPFTSEFNIADYFSIDSLTDFDLGLTTTEDNNNIQQQQQQQLLGSSRFQVTPMNSNVFSCRNNNQCSAIVGSSVNNSSLPTTTTATATLLGTTPSLSSTSCIPSSINSQTENILSNSLKQFNHQNQLNFHSQQRQLINSSSCTTVTAATTSILSKSLTSPGCKSVSSSVRLSGITNFGNGHQNGPINHSNNTAIVGNNSQILMGQKHHSASLLPGIIAQNKLASIARQQQKQEQQGQQGQGQQQMTTSGEITLNSNR